MFESDVPTPTGQIGADFSTCQPNAKDTPFDVIIVGSGYGAAMAAATWAGAKEDGRSIQICILERGQEYLPGDFPSTLDELPGHVRLSMDGRKPYGKPEALFDVRTSPDCGVLLGNGLGGGSLINGAVMIKPDFSSFPHQFPSNVVKELASKYLDRAAELLGAGSSQSQNTCTQPLKKSKALESLAGPGCTLSSTAITINMGNGAGAFPETELAPCTHCGDCMTGCNVGARASLDTQLLAKANRLGAKIYTQASVMRLRREENLWQVEVVHTNPNVQRRNDGPTVLWAKRVVLAAGALGSTELLLRSQTEGLKFSSRLGRQFSANGDNVAAIQMDGATDTYGLEHEPLDGSPPGTPSPRKVGPEITRCLSFPPTASEKGFLVQEFAVPAALRVLFQEIVTTRRFLEQLTQADWSRHRSFSKGERDPLAVDEGAMKNTLLVGIIGHDAGQGVMKLPGRRLDAKREGCLRIEWPELARDPDLHNAQRRLNQHIDTHLGKVDGLPRLTPNPFWNPMPKALSFLVNQNTGTGFTVHPLGGCCMGERPTNSVVNEWGAVWDCSKSDAADRDDWQSTLLVLDGAIVPGSLGANPALTIAALSLRAAEYWLVQWKWTAHTGGPNPSPKPRTHSRPLPDCTLLRPPQDTMVQIVERVVSEPLLLRRPGDQEREAIIELTFAFEPQSLSGLTTQGERTLKTDPVLASTLRIYERKDWDSFHLRLEDDAIRRQHAKVVASLSGSMRMLDREPNLPWVRATRAFLAYTRNRGGRDVLDWIGSKLRRSFDDGGGGKDSSFPPIRALATQCGEARTMDYDVKVLAAQCSSGWHNWVQVHDTIRGTKRLAYVQGESPWNQLLYLNLEKLGALRCKPGNERRAPRLKLDARFLAQRGIPLARITSQANQVRALVDQAQFALYGLRLALKTHLGSLRGPDDQNPAWPRQLPGRVSGLPPPEITELDMPGCDGRNPRHVAKVRLTRYPNLRSTRRPLVMIHGYSASGTSFAHDALDPGMARYFWEKGYDIWVLDLRTSPGMTTAKEPWAFEDVAWADIPLALCHIEQVVNRERGAATQLAVFAHCVGAVMISMALLTTPKVLSQAKGGPRRYSDEIARLQDRTQPLIDRLILSQKGFVVEYTDANILRAYLLNYAKGLLAGKYSFRRSFRPPLSEQLYDVFLDAMPYPHHEWKHEHPWFKSVPWSATRRRMDALYERTFNIENIPEGVLRVIDDFFGAINLETVSQVMHFARFGTITDKHGRNDYVSVANIQTLWPQGGTLLINASDNGMVDPHTGIVMEKLLKRAGVAHVHQVSIDGGHQDGLIGKRAVTMPLLQAVEAFLQ